MLDGNEIVYGVKRKTPWFAFDRLAAADELCLDYSMAVLPPTQYLLPPEEALAKFSVAPELSVRGTNGAQPFTVIGVHPYDLNAINLLDAVYLGENTDTNYQDRRKAVTIIGVDCLSPWPYSFAASLGTNLPSKNFDLWLTDLGDDYFIEVGSPKGEALLQKYFKPKKAGKAEARERDARRQEALKKYELALDISLQKMPELLEKSWESPMWAELGEKCFACGGCTMVCPTCVCFDVRDQMELNLTDGQRCRLWDSCMLKGFAKVASGENFRAPGEDRLRHRIYRKNKYLRERYGQLGCVGCGRCVHACLVDIASPVAAINRLVKEAK
ncbi:MAG: 4Fe-4S dicluster domain-containing protein [Chloroflexota bacterium]